MHRSRKTGIALPIPGLAGLLLGACIFVHAEDDGEDSHHVKSSVSSSSSSSKSSKPGQATARIEARSGSALSGKATFTEVPGGVEVRIHVSGAPPGLHAVHVHETGDCSAADASTAGNHFNPGALDHGAPHAAAHHAGDLGNMWVDEAGEGHHVVLMRELTVAAGDYCVVGRAIIVHEKADDLVTQPTGAAGGRIGCGVIQ